MDSVKAPGLRLGDVVTLEIEKGVYRGLGLARHHGQVVFVRHALPGESVRARVKQVSRGYVNAELVDFERASTARRTPPCPYVPRCGGCAYQEMEYAGQLALKASIVQEALDRSGVSWAKPIAVRGSSEEGWRTRATFHVVPGAEGPRLGLFEEGSHRIVEVDACLQVSDSMNRALSGLALGLRSRPALAAQVTGLELAESGDGRQLVVALVASGDAAQASAAAGLATDVPWLTGLLVATERGREGQLVLLRGEPYVENVVLDVSFRSHVRSFFQGNRHLVEPLAQAVIAALPESGPVVDLYSGVGLFSILAARKGLSVRSAELSPLAFKDAAFNARRAGVRHLTIAEADAGVALSEWPAERGEAIVIDPPRSGAEPRVITAIAARRPATLVYVSCDPPTLGRDLKRLVAAGYSVESIESFDLFPDTFHVETVAVLRA